MQEFSLDLLTQAGELLKDKSSTKRRTGAKKLRSLKNLLAGPLLLAALQTEILDPRTWETQYQMIMAIAESNYNPALSYLETLSHQKFEATMIYVALGDAIVRLSREYNEDPEPLLKILKMENRNLADGAFRAVATLRLKFNDKTIDQIFDYFSKQDPKELEFEGLKFWVVAAAAGWQGPNVESFLQNCLNSSRSDICEAALASLNKKYLKLNPL